MLLAEVLKQHIRERLRTDSKGGVTPEIAEELIDPVRVYLKQAAC